MSKLRKIAAFSVASMMALSMAGCADMSKIMTVDDYDVNAGVYLNYMLLGYMSQTSSSDDYISQLFTTVDNLNKEVENEDGKTVKLKDFLTDYAYDKTLDLVAIDKQFKNLGLELSAEDIAAINENANRYIESMDSISDDYLTEQGISRDSVVKCITADRQRELIFNYYYYGKDAEEAVKDKDIKNYLEENYVRYKQIAIPRVTTSTNTDDTGTTQSAKEQKKASKAAEKQASSLASKYYDLAWKNENFDQVISQYDIETNEPTEAPTEAPSEEETEPTVADSEGTEATEPNDATITPADEPKEVHVHFYDPNGVEYQEGTPQAPQIINSGEKAVRPEDPIWDTNFYQFDNWYTNENYSSVFDFDQEIVEDTSVFANFKTNEILANISDEENISDLVKYVRDEMKIDEPTLYSEDDCYYILIKYNPAKRTDFLTGNVNYEYMLNEMRYEDFEAKIDNWHKDLNIKKNDKAFKKYTPAKIEEIHNDIIAG